MDLKKLKEVPKSYVKEILRSLSKFERLKKIPFFAGIHFKDAEKELDGKIEGYRMIDRQSARVWRIVELSRDGRRPQCLDYVKGIFTDFVELSGDRLAGEDKSVMAGLGKIGGRTVAILGQNKGKDTKERIKYNFGMSVPEGYRKSIRIMDIADRFGFPVVTFVDTPAAYAGMEAEDKGQAGAIATSILKMFEVSVPIIVVLIGEGGSGGALALAVGNEVAMLENSTYSVITPEGCAAILWRDPAGTKLAARALKITSPDLARLKVVDRIIHEPMGGAHNDPRRMVKIVKRYLTDALGRWSKFSGEELKMMRAQRFEKFGFFEETDTF
ncbi:MAG: acetyl-CoA carboxylase carboxyltransferase subunit alpha [Actinobacteria bacterium]|nr:acetyl-CoA carboxylase carboxyltransferase subunit alpha [Actinomycetota bacterium]